MRISRPRCKVIMGSLFGLCAFTQLCSAEQSLRSTKAFLPTKTSRLLDKGDSLPTIVTKRYNQAVSSQIVSQIGDSIERQTDTDCGKAVDILENDIGTTYLLIGCPGTNIRKGSAYLYELLPNNEWKQNSMGVGSNDNDFYGSSVSLAQRNNEIIAAIGAYGYNGSLGRVSILRIDTSSANGNSPIEFIEPSDAIGKSFGYDLDLTGDGNKIAVGALGTNDRKPYVQKWKYDGTNWSEGNQEKQSGSGDEDIDVSISDNGKLFSVANSLGSQKDSNDNAILYGGNIERRFPEGRRASLSGNGEVIAIGYPLDNCEDDTSSNCGMVEVFNIEQFLGGRIGSAIFGNDPGEQCGKSLDSSRDGRRIVIGCNNRLIIATRNDNNAWDIERVENLNLFNLESVAISSDGTKIAVGSKGRNGNNNGLVQVFKVSTEPTSPSPPTPTAPSPSKPSPTATSPSAKGKGKKQNGKGSKKSKGKGKKKYSCLVDAIVDSLTSSSFNIAKSEFIFQTNGDPTLDDLNKAACDNDRVRTRYLSRALQEKPKILAVGVTSLKKRKPDCNGECKYDVEANIFYSGNDDFEDGQVETFLEDELDGSVSKLTIESSGDERVSQGSSPTSSSVSTGQEFQEYQEYETNEGSSNLLWSIFASVCAVVLIGAVTILFINHRARNRTILSPVPCGNLRYRNSSDNGYDEIKSCPSIRYEQLANEDSRLGPDVQDDRLSFPIDILKVEDDYISNLPQWTAFDG